MVKEADWPAKKGDIASYDVHIVELITKFALFYSVKRKMGHQLEIVLMSHMETISPLPKGGYIQFPAERLSHAIMAAIQFRERRKKKEGV